MRDTLNNYTKWISTNDSYTKDMEARGGIRSFCKDPIQKMKVGSYRSNEDKYTTTLPYKEFLKINLK